MFTIRTKTHKMHETTPSQPSWHKTEWGGWGRDGDVCRREQLGFDHLGEKGHRKGFRKVVICNL